MYVGVLLHVGLLVESLSTEGAGVGPGVRVNEQVCRQGAAPLESFATLRTLKQELIYLRWWMQGNTICGKVWNTVFQALGCIGRKQGRKGVHSGKLC